jgi:hypothetical protein
MAAKKMQPTEAAVRGDRPFKLASGTTSEPGRYVKSLWGARGGPQMGTPGPPLARCRDLICH